MDSALLSALALVHLGALAVWIVHIGVFRLLVRVASVGHNEQIELALNNVGHYEHPAATLVETSGDALCWVRLAS